MKRHRNWLKTLQLIIIFLFCLPFFNYGQPPDVDGDPDAPIDGGIGILIATGVGYGLKKYKDAKKKNQEDNSK